MRYNINLHNSLYKDLVNLDTESWNLYKGNKKKECLSLNQQFFFYIENNKSVLNNESLPLQKLLNSQRILNTLSTSKIKKSVNKNITLLYKVNADDEVTYFEGYIDITKNIELKKLYEHIDIFLYNYENSKENVPVVFCYKNKNTNINKINLDISYENDGYINFYLTKHGFFSGESLFLFKDIGFNYEKDFKFKIFDILKYFENVYTI